MTGFAEAQSAIIREWEGVCELLDRLDYGAWLLPTRCEGWTVTELVRHMCWGTSFEADGLRLMRTEEPGVATGIEPTANETSELLSELTRHVDSLGAELGALEADYQDRVVPMSYGDLPVPLALTVFTMEAGMHSSDLRSAISIDDALEPDITQAAFDYLRVFGPVAAEQAGSVLVDCATVALRGSSTLRFGQNPDGSWYVDDSTEATASIAASDDSDLMLFAFGRRPIDAVEVSGDIDLGRRFKQLVPGP
jgi:uncharacterized protein (TIGR03083 family)